MLLETISEPAMKVSSECTCISFAEESMLFVLTKVDRKYCLPEY